MFHNRGRSPFVAVFTLFVIAPAQPSGAAGATNTRCGNARFNTCPFRYNVPSQVIPNLLKEVWYCAMATTTQVMCSQPLRGNYGQTQIQTQTQAQPRAQNSVPVSLPIPSTPPPMGVALERRADADQLWQRASALLDRNRYRDSVPLLYQGALLGDKRAEATLGIDR